MLARSRVKIGKVKICRIKTESQTRGVTGGIIHSENTPKTKPVPNHHRKKEGKKGEIFRPRPTHRLPIIPDPQLALFLPLSPSKLFCTARSRRGDRTALNPLEWLCEWWGVVEYELCEGIPPNSPLDGWTLADLAGPVLSTPTICSWKGGNWGSGGG